MTCYRNILTLTPNSGTITCLSFSRLSTSRLASGTDRGVVQIWDTRNGTTLHEIKRRASVSSLLWDPTRSHHLFVGAADGSIIFFSTDGVDVSEKHSAHLPVHFESRSILDTYPAVWPWRVFHRIDGHWHWYRTTRYRNWITDQNHGKCLWKWVISLLPILFLSKDYQAGSDTTTFSLPSAIPEIVPGSMDGSFWLKVYNLFFCGENKLVVLYSNISCIMCVWRLSFTVYMTVIFQDLGRADTSEIMAFWSYFQPDVSDTSQHEFWCIITSYYTQDLRGLLKISKLCFSGPWFIWPRFGCVGCPKNLPLSFYLSPTSFWRCASIWSRLHV